MGFRDREKERLIALKAGLFDACAISDGMYKDKERQFCLDAAHASQNLHPSIREEAKKYFAARGIHWHDGLEDGSCPSNHLLCSQTACVNAWFPFSRDPQGLLKVVCDLGYPADEMLPMTLDTSPEDPEPPFVSFEWIGQKNYLGELYRGKPAQDAKRTRGRNFTSADFAFRFRQHKDIHIVMGEWKYTENYRTGESKRLAKGKKQTDRKGIYGTFFQLDDSPMALHDGIELEDLMFDPFDQLMRLQLLAKEMERHHEMGATVVSVMHVAPEANGELMHRVTSPRLATLGTDVHSIWNVLVKGGTFKSVASEHLYPILTKHAADPAVGEYLSRRYSGMK